MTLKYSDLAKGALQSIAKHGKLRRSAMMVAAAALGSPADAEVSDDLWDCTKRYADDTAKCDNAYSDALVSADDEFEQCLQAHPKHAFGCFEAYMLALDNADLAFDTCEARAAADWMHCFGADEAFAPDA